MSQFQRRIVIGSIVYVCVYAPVFVLLWVSSRSLPSAESDRLLYFVAPFHILALASGITAEVIVIRHILKSPFSSRWTRDAWLAFVIFAPQLGPIAWLIHTAGEFPNLPTTDDR
jgi:hypothetical protein